MSGPTAGIVTIVSGLPRSGTSLMMQILERAGIPPMTDAQRSPDADNPRGYYEDERVKTLGRDAAWVRRAGGGAVKIIAVQIQHLPPDLACRVVYMQRDLDEVLASQRAMLARLGRSGAQLSADALRTGLRSADDAARALIAQRAWPLLIVEHAKLIAQPSAAVARVLAFVGSAADPAEVASAVDPALHRQRSSHQH